MLMALNDLTEAEAFDTLRRVSQEANIKLVDVAAAMVKRHTRGAAGEI